MNDDAEFTVKVGNTAQNWELLTNSGVYFSTEDETMDTMTVVVMTSAELETVKRVMQESADPGHALK